MNRLIGIAAILGIGAAIMFFIYKVGFDNSADGKKKIAFADTNKVEDLYENQEGGQFGADRVKQGQDAKPVPFDGKRAIKYLEAICELGPRISGSAAMRKQQDLIKKHFEDLGAKVTYQSFEAPQNSVRGNTPMTNIIISYQPDKKRRVILCSHYDTRPIADQEKDPRDWHKPFLSANDGGSGVALLMEMGHHMKNLKTNVGVDFVIFDGEEYVFKSDRTDPGRRDLHDRYFIGSEYFAKTWRQSKNRCDYSAAVLLDMIAGKDLQIKVEEHSYRAYPDLCKEIWGIAREQNARSFLPDWGYKVQDDHLSLQKVQIPAIDLIDFDYEHWHKLADTPANCSAENMEQVAKVLSVWLQRTK
jgi:hypothetical protein